jgi:hypothetical protein
LTNEPDGKPKERSPAIAAAIILLVAGTALYLLPTVVLTLARISPWLATVAGVAIILAFFVVFWLRARYQRRKGD